MVTVIEVGQCPNCKAWMHYKLLKTFAGIGKLVNVQVYLVCKGCGYDSREE